MNPSPDAVQNIRMKPTRTFRGVVIRSAGAAPVVPSPRAVPPDGSRVRVSREVSGRGGKGVSVISGLPLNDAGLATLAGQLKKSCGAGGAVKAGRIEIQGDHRDRLVAELVRLGYAAKRSGG